MPERLPHPTFWFLEGRETQAVSSHVYAVVDNMLELRKPHSRQILVISGTPGAGKDAIARTLAQEDCFGWPRTLTTRQQIRQDEIERDPYLRVSEQEFMRLKVTGSLIESNMHYRHWYGSVASEIESVWGDGKTPIMRLDPNGVLTYRQKTQEQSGLFAGTRTIGVFVTTPSQLDIYHRLVERNMVNSGEDGNGLAAAHAQARDRWGVVLDDLARMHFAHFIAVNEDNKLSEVAGEIADLLEF